MFSLDIQCICHYCKDKAVANIKGQAIICNLSGREGGGGGELNNQEVLLALFSFCFIW